MTRDDATALIGILVSAFPKAVGAQTIDLYVSQIEGYDLDPVRQAVMNLARRNEFFPSLAVLLGAIHSIPVEREAAVEEESWAKEPPHWVGVQKHARAVGDTRIVPEQIPGYVEIGQPLPPLPWDVNDETYWVQPGEYGYVPSGYAWGLTAEVCAGCCFHPEDEGLPTRLVMIVGPLAAMRFRMCLRCAATYEHRRAA